MFKHLSPLFMLVVVMISISCKKSPTAITQVFVSPSSSPPSTVSDNPFPNSILLGELSKATNDISAVGCMNKLFFAGYGGINDQTKRNITVVDVFDLLNKSKESHVLSIGRKFIAVGATDSKVFFAGGQDDAIVTSRVDIYDLLTNTWSTAELSFSRYNISVATVNNKIYFVGGQMESGVNTSRIDIYDASTNSWSIAESPFARSGLTTVVIGNKIIFSGGVQSFDTATGTWSFIFSNRGGSETNAGVLYNSVYFIGSPGNIKDMSIIDIYDIRTGTRKTHAINQSKTDVQVAVSNGKIAFFGGILVKDGTGSRQMDIYDGVSGLWSSQSLNNTIVDETILSYNNKIYSAGGRINDGAKEINSIFAFELN